LKTLGQVALQMNQDREEKVIATKFLRRTRMPGTASTGPARGHRSSLIFLYYVALLAGAAVTADAQTTFSVTGTQIPPDLVRVNYGKIPNTIEAFDLNICNDSNDKHGVTASQIYQALAESNVQLRPLGGQIMFAMILQNQKRSATTVLSLVLTSAVGVLSVLGASRGGIPPKTLASAALGAAVGQQLLSTLKPALTADQLQRYESQVLESALVLDSGSCVERTVFALVVPGTTSNRLQTLTFHVR
jgi:hypothetical protein